MINSKCQKKFRYPWIDLYDEQKPAFYMNSYNIYRDELCVC